MKSQKPEKEYLRAFFRGNKLLFAGVLLLDLVMGVAQMLCSLLLGAVTDSMTAGDGVGLLRLGLYTVAAIPFFALVMWLGRKALARFRRRAMIQYKALAFDRISSKGISAFARENTGRYLSALTNDSASVETQYLNNIPALVYQIFSFVLSLGVMLYYSPVLMLVMVLTCVLPMAVSVIMSGKYAALEQQVSNENEKYTSRIKDLLSGFSVIKSFKAEKETGKLFENTSVALEKKKEKKECYSGALESLSSAAALISQLGTFLVGAYMAVSGYITPGTVLIFVNLCNSVINPIQSVPAYLAGIRAAKALIRKLALLAQENADRGGDPIPPVLEEGITFRNVSFAYEEGKTVLSGIDLTLEKGKKYAIVGASGSGKSTLLNLLMGAYDGYQGSVTVDSREMRGVDPDSLYDLMSLIGQNVFLFDSSIRENITMFRQFPDHAVDAAVEKSGLAEVIAAKGAAYRCGENGVGLSGGERQRVSIARSLLRGTQVLMMDEATAALDNQTAFEVTDAILHLDGLTRIVVTHRLEERLLKQYDRIIVLRDGRITEQGSFHELMAKTGYFYSLYTVSNG